MKLIQLFDAKKESSKTYKALALVTSFVISCNYDDEDYWHTVGKFLFLVVNYNLTNNSYIVHVSKDNSLRLCRLNVVIIKNRLVSCVINYFYDTEI